MLSRRRSVVVALVASAALLAACSWLGFARPLNRAAFWLVCFTFVFHTLALIGRIYISGRPPVTNLYSSAVFIGWGVLLLYLPLYWYRKRVEDKRGPAAETVAPPAGGIVPGGAGD